MSVCGGVFARKERMRQEKGGAREREGRGVRKGKEGCDLAIIQITCFHVGNPG